MSTFLSSLYRLRRGPSASFGERILKLLARPVIKAALRREPDPAVEVDLGRRKLWMNWSHNLPSFLVAYPNYETEIGRLAAFIHRKFGQLMMIDVGANVGDTVATLPELPHAKFLCIEGSRKYFDLLGRNFGANPNVCCVNALMSDGDAEVTGRSLIELGGTAHLEPTARGIGDDTPVATLDAIVAKHPEFESANLLKIDTDGFDFRVMKGSGKLLARAKPALHFELSFRLWQDVGKTDVANALRWLCGAGYRSGILYDNLGFLIGTDLFEAPVKLPALHEYALRRHDFYLNVIAFHEQSGCEAEYLAGEREHHFQ